MRIKKKQIYRILTTALVLVSVVSLGECFKIKKLKIALENNYNRAFHELVNYVDDIDTLLQKSMLLSSAAQLSTISQDLYQKTSNAKACIAQLPINEIKLENIEKFLAQTGDFTYVLSQNVIKNNDITDKEYNTLSSLSDYAGTLNKALLKMQSDIYENKISFGTINKKANLYFNKTAYAKGNDILTDLESVEKEFHEYPSLIYDGPFSEHIQNMKPQKLISQKVLSQDELLKKAKEILKKKGNSLKFSGKSINTSMNSYSFIGTYNENDSITISLTEKGGFPLYFLDSRTVNEEKISVEEAKTKAKKYLSDIGYTSLTDSYYDKSNGIATINFAYVQSGIICYSDLIKVKVALDNGEIVGFTADGYIMNNKHRTFSEINLSANEAKSKINKHLKIDSYKLALIPTASKKEVLCYEFKGNHKGKNFLIYINAENGQEEEIFMLLESENGILSV